jgi:hypothetical protein
MVPRRLPAREVGGVLLYQPAHIYVQLITYLGCHSYASKSCLAYLAQINDRLEPQLTVVLGRTPAYPPPQVGSVQQFLAGTGHEGGYAYRIRLIAKSAVC